MISGVNRNGMCGLAGVLFATAAANADMVLISSNGYGLEGNGAFTGSITYTAGTGTLLISLTNDASTLSGGKITAFAFNIDGDAVATLTNAGGYGSFVDLGHSVDCDPLGTLENGAGLGGSWLGGGSPNAGIAVGATGVFTFHVTGAGAGSLTAANFVEGPAAHDFAVRSRGFANGGSEKAEGFLVPAPGVSALLGLAGLAGLRRKR